MSRSSWWALWLVSLFPSMIFAEVHLPALFSDHAVLQREQPIHIWGTSDAQEDVSIQFHDQKVSARADKDGDWEAWLAPEHAGGPFSLKVSGSATPVEIERTDILVGDVWIASGQSNMEFPLAGFAGAPLRDGEKEIEQANQPELRLLLQHRRTSDVVLSDTEDSWTLCTPDTARHFSAIAYFFGREISSREHVPVGLIDTTWGGTPAHSWISLDGIASANLPSVAADAGRIARDQGRADQIRERDASEDAALKAAGKPVPDRGRIPDDHGGSWTPGTLYNAMIAPFTRYTIKGAIWYQGESDGTAERAPNYERVFSALIQDWRRQWAEGAFPFLFVQISSYGKRDADWGMLRDAQRRVSEEVKNAGMAVTLDVGLTDNIHPPDKQTVAARLALLARSIAYGEDIESNSLSFQRATVEGNSIRIWFSNAAGLKGSSEPLGDFEVAGEDHVFAPAAGRIENGTVVITSAAVPNPRFVRYGWKGTVTNWIFNASGLPAGTFTSER